MHAWGDVRRLADLISARETSIKDLIYQDPKTVRIDGCQGVAFDYLPATLADLRWAVPRGVGDEAAVRLYSFVSECGASSCTKKKKNATDKYYGLIVLHGA